MSSLYFTGMAPSATEALSKAQKASMTFGARVFIFFKRARFSFLYIKFECCLLLVRCAPPDTNLEIVGVRLGFVCAGGNVVFGLELDQFLEQCELRGRFECFKGAIGRAVV